MSLASGGLLAGILDACRGRTDTAPSTADAPPPFKELVVELQDRGDGDLQVFQGASEFIVGGPQRIPFRLDRGVETAEKGTARMWLGRGTKVSGPFPLTFRRFQHGGGFWEASAPMPGTGVVDIAVELTDGAASYGFTVVEVKSGPVVPAVRDQAIKVPTPTTASPIDPAMLCTREPACGMHEVSLDQALASGTQVVMTIGSPKLCSSGVCGPVVDEVMQLKRELEGIAYIHLEPYQDSQATTLVEAAKAWRLSTEPWTFVMDRSGAIAARFEGPVTLDSLRGAVG